MAEASRDSSVEMFRNLRIAVLLYILAFAAVANYLASARSTDWNAPLWVDVYPVNGDGSDRVQAYIDNLTEADFDIIEVFLTTEAQRYGVSVATPFRLELAGQVDAPIPELSPDGSVLDALLWSLRMRWFATRVEWASDRPSPDIQLFAIFHDETRAAILDRSAALERGLVAVANVFASRSSRGSNQVVMAHELLHTLGASDKYQPGTNLPLFPIGYAEPDAKPLHPQRHAELMAGRIAIDPQSAEIPPSLRHTVVGPATAFEIGWLSTP